MYKNPDLHGEGASLVFHVYPRHHWVVLGIFDYSLQNPVRKNIIGDSVGHRIPYACLCNMLCAGARFEAFFLGRMSSEAIEVRASFRHCVPSYCLFLNTSDYSFHYCPGIRSDNVLPRFYDWNGAKCKEVTQNMCLFPSGLRI